MGWRMPDTTSPVLLPCPFCGGPATLEAYPGTFGRPEAEPAAWYAACDACDFAFPSQPTAEDAAALWNRRAPSETSAD